MALFKIYSRTSLFLSCEAMNSEDPLREETHSLKENGIMSRMASKSIYRFVLFLMQLNTLVLLLDGEQADG